MKSVTFSEVVRIAAAPAGGGATRFALALALGLPALILAFHWLDPLAPLPYIILPVLAGGMAPVLAALPGRLEVTTRFEAQLLVRNLDETLAALGYQLVERRPKFARYRTSGSRWLDKEVAVRVHSHSIEFLGHVPTLRSLQATLAR